MGGLLSGRRFCFWDHGAVNLFIFQVDLSFYVLETHIGTSFVQYVCDSLKFLKFNLFQMAAGFTNIIKSLICHAETFLQNII